MKKLTLGLALVACSFGCKTDKNTSVSDASSANMPAKECTAGKKECCQEGAAAKKSCCQEKAAPQN